MILQDAFYHVDDLLARMAVFGERRTRGDINTNLDDLATGNAQIIPLKIGTFDIGLLLRLGYVQSKTASDHQQCCRQHARRRHRQ